MAAGDYITGTASGGAARDYFRVKTAAAPPGIYRYRLVLTSASSAKHAGSLCGLSQTNGGCGVDGVIGTNELWIQNTVAYTDPPRMNQWYDAGNQAEIYYLVKGAMGTTTYTATLFRDQITPILGPTDIPAGPVLITTENLGHSNNTDLWVYDANFLAIPGYGNDNASYPPPDCLEISAQSRLLRDFTPGTYYLAVTINNLANHLPSPGDEAQNPTPGVSAWGPVFDFPGATMCNFLGLAGEPGSDCTVSIAGTVVPATRDRFETAWIRFVVVGCSCPGDTTVDGNNRVDENDIPSFVNALLGVTPQICADVNMDEDVRGDDIQLFVERVLALTPCPRAIITCGVDLACEGDAVGWCQYEVIQDAVPGVLSCIGHGLDVTSLLSVQCDAQCDPVDTVEAFKWVDALGPGVHCFFKARAYQPSTPCSSFPVGLTFNDYP